MKPSSVLPSVLSFSTLATAATVGYTLTAQAPGTSIDGKSVHANGGGLWIGKPTASFCPAAQLPKGACPKGKDTVVLVNEDPEDSCPEHAACGTAAMSVEVPGGQQLYVGPDLALGFTPPHSGFIPTGSFTSGFSLSIHGRFGWEALDATCGKFSACPVGKPGKAPVPYQIYGQKGGNPSKEQKRHCVDIVLHANPVEELGAWEYT